MADVWGSEFDGVLLQRHYEDVKSSGLSDEIIRERGYRSILGKGDPDLHKFGFGKNQRNRVPCLLLPVHGTDGGNGVLAQIKPDNPRKNTKGKVIKYESPKGAGMRIDCPPRCRDKLADPNIDLWVTEGIKKADSLADQGECAIDLLGVWNFKGRNEWGGITLLADLDYIAWEERNVYIVFDSDIVHKQEVRQALDRLAEHLERKRARVLLVHLPSEDGGKVGVDDYLLTHTLDELKALISAARPQEGGVSRYFDGKTFLPAKLAKVITEMQHFVHLSDKLKGPLYYYEGGVFKPGGEVRVRSLAKEILGDFFCEYRAEGTIYDILTTEQVDPELANRHIDLINVKNGMLNCRTGELLPHDPEYLSTIQLPVTYEQDVAAPSIERFLEEVVPDPECRDILLEFVGYLLLPTTKHRKALMLTGTGANGKSVFLSLVEAFLGRENVSHVAVHDFEENRFKRAMLYGKLANVCADLDSRALKSSSFFKMIVSGDRIDAERKNKDPFEFKPFARLLFSANRPPGSHDRSDAFFDRWLIVPFPNKFEGDDADPNILTKLTTPRELTGLLNHALTGLRNLERRGYFRIPKKMAQALEDYRRRSDSIFAFIEECCEIRDYLQVSRQGLFDAYRAFCEEAKLFCMSQQKFNSELEIRYPGLERDRRTIEGQVVSAWIGGPGPVLANRGS